MVAGEHFILPDLPFYVVVQKADPRTRKARLNNREVKEKRGFCERLRVANGPRPVHLLVLQQRRRRRFQIRGNK